MQAPRPVRRATRVVSRSARKASSAVAVLWVKTMAFLGAPASKDARERFHPRLVACGGSADECSQRPKRLGVVAHDGKRGVGGASSGGRRDQLGKGELHAAVASGRPRREIAPRWESSAGERLLERGGGGEPVADRGEERGVARAPRTRELEDDEGVREAAVGRGEGGRECAERREHGVGARHRMTEEGAERGESLLEIVFAAPHDERTERGGVELLGAGAEEEGEKRVQIRWTIVDGRGGEEEDLRATRQVAKRSVSFGRTRSRVVRFVEDHQVPAGSAREGAGADAFIADELSGDARAAAGLLPHGAERRGGDDEHVGRRRARACKAV